MEPSSSSSIATNPDRGSSFPSTSNTSTSSDTHHYNNNSTRHNGGTNNRFLLFNFVRAPVSTSLEYLGILPTLGSSRLEELDGISNGDDSEEISIRIVGNGGQDSDRGTEDEMSRQNETLVQSIARTVSAARMDVERGSRGDDGIRGGGGSGSVNDNADVEANDGVAVGVNNGRDSPYQRYDIQQAARWAEQILPFSLLLFVIFIRQHLQGFFVTIWIAAFLFKSNDILCNQTALKGERKILVLVSLSILFTLHVAVVYWLYGKDDVLYPLVMLPPKTVPPFWHAIFIIVLNDIMARQASMVLKCFLLIYYKNTRGRNRRQQGQMLTLVEYLLLLYRALLPAPVWYRFFLNNEYGGLFSSLMTGLYLTFKVTSIVEKVRSFISSIKALSRKEVHYGAYATSEQVNAAGDLCTICQEKMHAPVVLRCKHVFCEECVSEWFERERTCPLCRSLVRASDMRSFGDGSTSLLFQLF